MKKYLLLCIGGILMIVCGCTSKSYRVDYDGLKEFYTNAKDTYKAGETVTVYFNLIATDTDYSFYLDAKRIPFLYDEDKGFKITFTMPDHDVKLTRRMVDSMMYIPEPRSFINYVYEDSDTDYALFLKHYENESDTLDVMEDDDINQYEIPDSCYEKVMQLIKDNDISSYKDYPANTEGDYTITLSYLEDNQTIKVSSTQMSGHEDMLEKILETLKSYIPKER